jgi:hypothetical protein
MKATPIRVAALLAGLVAALTIPSFAAVAVPTGRDVPTTTPPHIVATPNDVMVNMQISLAGAGFQPHTGLRIRECSTTEWVVMAQHVCDWRNTIRVHTDRFGRFTAPFTVELCPRSSSGSGPITQETCYIGAPVPQGVDTIVLRGAAQITVTYP